MAQKRARWPRSGLIPWVIIILVWLAIGQACGAPAATLAPTYLAPTQKPVETAALAFTQAPAVTKVFAPTQTPVATAPGMDGSGGAAPQPIDLNLLLQQAIAGLPEGRMLFNPPSKMRQGEKARIELRIMPLDTGGIDEASLRATLEAGLIGYGQPQIEPVKVGTVVRSNLTGDGFVITPLNNEEQIVSGDTYTEWAWDVRAQKTGVQQLNLMVSVIVNVQGIGEKGRDLPVKTKSVNVQVDPVYLAATFFGNNWPWVFLCILIPVAVWQYWVYTHKKSPKEKVKKETKAAKGRPEVIEYLDFDLEMEKETGPEYSIHAQSQVGEAREKATLPFSKEDLAARLKQLQGSLSSINGAPATSGGEKPDGAAQRLGADLFAFLMSGDIRSQYDLLRQEAAERHKGVRVKLRILAPEIAALPWEYLYDEREHDFVALSRDTPIVRYIEMPRPVLPLTANLPLRILGMVASPKDLPPLDVEVEKQRIEQAMQGLVSQQLVQLSWVEGSTWRDLEKSMLAGTWHVFHFVGHGIFDSQSNEGSIALEKEDGNCDLFSATQFGRLLADENSLRLVFLNACQSGQTGSSDLFSSMASVLSARGVPAVVAMQSAISDRAAIEFTRSFYEALADGVPVDAAMSEARKALAMDHAVEWGVPVLYMHTSNGVLFKTR